MEVNNGLTLTLNKMGYMFNDLTAYGEAFINFCTQINGPVLEIGAAYGVASLRVLETNTKIVSNDLDERHLKILLDHVPPDKKNLIETVSGKFPQQLAFSPSSFDAILVSNVIHFLNTDEMEIAILKLHEWLRPGGKVFIIAATPYVRIWQEFIPLFKRNLANAVRWPGYIDDFSIFKSHHRKEHMPSFIHFFDPENLSKKFNAFNFSIEKYGYCARPDWPVDMQLDGRESMGLIAQKASS